MNGKSKFQFTISNCQLAQAGLAVVGMSRMRLNGTRDLVAATEILLAACAQFAIVNLQLSICNVFRPSNQHGNISP